MAEPTGWMTNCPILAQALSVLCPGQSERHVHEDVMGGNSKWAQVYPPLLCRAIIDGLERGLKEINDSRYSVKLARADEQFHRALPCRGDEWEPAGYVYTADVLFLDVDRTEQA